MERENNLQSTRALFFSVLLLGVVLHTQGYCDSVHEMDAMTDSVMNTIFSPWVKKSALVFGGGAGLFQSYMGGSIKPLLLWGGLGLAVNYIPKVVNVIAGI